jgi:uncharacterized protein YxjI
MINNRAPKVLSILFLLLVLCAGRVGAVATILFEPYVTYSVVTPHAVGVGDFNHDGLNDAAVTNLTGVGFAGELKIFLQNITGSLDSAVAYAAGTRTEALAVGDLNNDGWDDVVVTNANSNTISVFLQQANGTLAARTTYVTGIGPDAVAVGDVNGDGLDDVAVANWNSAFISIFIQNGSGTLNAKVDYASPQAGYDDIAIGDVNGDGLNDVVKMNGQLYANPDLSVFTQTGVGTLNSAVSYSVTGNLLGSGIGIGDVTGDGKTDVVMSYGGNTPTAFIAVFAQLGNGTLKPPVSYTTYDVPEALEVADVNEDGLADVIVAHGGWNATSVHLQQNDGTLGSYSLYALPNNSASHYKPQGLAIGDINADTLLDVLVANYNFGLNVLYHVPPPNTDIFIGGTLMDDYYVPPGQSISDRYGINGGPVHVVSTKKIFTSQRAIFGSSFNSIVGYPGNQLTTDYWFTSYDDVGMITYLVIGNPDPSLTALVDVYIGGVKKNTTPYSIAPGQRIFPRYGINAGPVHVVSTNEVAIFTSERTKFGNSFNEVMGHPGDQLTTDYWFTSYDDAGMITYLVVGNPHPTLTAEVDVYIGGVKNNPTPYSIAPGQRIFPRYGINAGPVHVVSTNGVDIFTSERTKFGNTFNEVMGYPGDQLTTEFWFTSYDDVGMITFLVVGNPHPTLTAQVDVYIGGVKKNTTPYSIAPGQRIFQRYGINSGPVRVISTNGVDVFASERSKYLSSFNEILGIADNQLTTDYWFTSYDDVGMVTNLVIASP